MLGIFSLIFGSKLLKYVKDANDDYELKKKSSPNLDYYVDSRGRARLKTNERICAISIDSYGNKKLKDAETLEIIHDYEKEKNLKISEINKDKAVRAGKEFYVIGRPKEYEKYEGIKYRNVNDNKIYVVRKIYGHKSYYIDINTGNIGRVTYRTEFLNDKNEQYNIDYYNNRVKNSKIDCKFINLLKKDEDSISDFILR